MECRKCPYFEKKRDAMHMGRLILGFCRLREKHISDETMGRELCKDRAVIEASELKKIPKDESEDAFIKRAAFGGS